MRCPKCGYISFDVVDKCVKCRKNISAAAAELKGTVVSVPAPGFLSLDYAGPKAEPKAEQEEARPEPEEEAYALSDEEGEVFVDFSSGEGPAVEAEAAGEAEFAVEAEAAAEEPEFGEEAIDIADLAPVEKAAAPIEETGSEEFAIAIGDEKSSVSESTGQGLEDLKVEGIDLFASPQPPSGKDNVMPSVKTGTALDAFDVDLEELFRKK